MDDRQKLNLLYLTGGIAAITLVLVFGTTIFNILIQHETKEAIAQQPKPDPFAGIKLEAEAAIVYDIENSQVVYAKSPEAQLPLASLTKTMTALVASKLMPSGTIVPISSAALQIEGDSGLDEGENWKLSELINFTLVTSSNDGAKAIAETTERLTNRNFISEMNSLAQSLNMSQTYFHNETGLDLNIAQPGSYGSAYDMAKLFSYILKEKPEILAATSKSVVRAASLSQDHYGSNTNTLAAVMPGIMGSKTGYTELAGGNLAVIVDAGLRQPYVIVVMGSSQDGRFSDVRRLASALSNWTLTR